MPLKNKSRNKIINGQIHKPSCCSFSRPPFPSVSKNIPFLSATLHRCDRRLGSLAPLLYFWWTRLFPSLTYVIGFHQAAHRQLWLQESSPIGKQDVVLISDLLTSMMCLETEKIHAHRKRSEANMRPNKKEWKQLQCKMLKFQEHKAIFAQWPCVALGRASRRNLFSPPFVTVYISLPLQFHFTFPSVQNPDANPAKGKACSPPAAYSQMPPVL